MSIEWPSSRIDRGGPAVPDSAATFDVEFGDVTHSQIVIGDHATVQTADGVKVVYLVGEANRPTPRLRPRPVTRLPGDDPRPLGRERELELGRAARPGAALELYGVDGAGKTALLKHLAY